VEACPCVGEEALGDHPSEGSAFKVVAGVIWDIATYMSNRQGGSENCDKYKDRSDIRKTTPQGHPSCQTRGHTPRRGAY